MPQVKKIEKPTYAFVLGSDIKDLEEDVKAVGGKVKLVSEKDERPLVAVLTMFDNDYTLTEGFGIVLENGNSRVMSAEVIGASYEPVEAVDAGGAKADAKSEGAADGKGKSAKK